jgi:ribosomal protein S18 acetylase RimI-like enzyme
MPPETPLSGLRRALPADAPAIADLVAAAYGIYVERMGTPPAPMLDDYAEVVATAETWVVERDSNLAAAIVLRSEDGYLLVENVAVHPTAQGQGLGRSLLALAEARAAAAGLPEMRLYTNALMVENIALYSRLGWEETHRATEHGFDRVYFRRRVSAS